ncbi:MAG: hypothetical protein AAFV07_19465, partial [Bacteroidota bacterium]
WVGPGGYSYMVGTLTSQTTLIDTLTVLGTGHFVASFNENGTVRFATLLPSEALTVSAVTFDEMGHVFVGGTFIDSISFGATNLPPVPDTVYPGIFLAQYDTSGTPTFAEAFVSQVAPPGPMGDNSINDLSVDEQGNLYIVGSFEDQLNIGPFTMLGNNVTQDSMNSYLARRNADGTYAFAEDVFSTGLVQMTSVAPDRDGGAYVTGVMSRSIPFGVGVFPGSYGTMRGFIVRYDSLGNALWGETLSAIGIGDGVDVTSDADGNVFLFGRYRGDSVRLANTFLTDDDTLDSYVARFDPGGQLDWIKETSVPAGEGIGHHLGLGQTGEIYGAGISLFSGGAAIIGCVNVEDYNTIGGNAGFLVKMTDPLFTLPPDSVWPGDANYDLVANNQDLLAIGVAFGLTGPPRANASLNWTGQPSVDWTDTLPGGINFKHADTDGNGVVNTADTVAINLNYGLTHNKNEGVQKAGPLLAYSFKTD